MTKYEYALALPDPEVGESEFMIVEAFPNWREALLAEEKYRMAGVIFVRRPVGEWERCGND